MPNDVKVNHRIKFLAIICLAVMAVFVMRLFYLQIVEHDKYIALANKEQLKRLSIPAKRGEIYMMDDGRLTKVVLNQTVYTMFVDPAIVDEPEKVKDAIREVVGGNAVDGFSKLVDKKETRYQVVAKTVTRTQAQLIKKRQLKGIGFQAESRRVYPEKKLAAQTLGFVNFEGNGQYGIEGMFDKELKGKNGLLQAVTDVSNLPLTIGNKNIDLPAQDGRNIVLTLDRNIQAYSEQALARGVKRSGADSGSVIVMDPNTGKVLAMSSLPTYDPSKYNVVTNAQAFNLGAVNNPYEPGSVMKTFTMATGIDTGAVKPSSTYVNTDYIKVEDRTITNASKGETGTITFQHALNWSLNTGMVTVAERLGNGTIDSKARSTMYRYLHDKFKLGELTGIEVSGEAAGRIIAPDEADGNAVRYSNMTFGQGMDLTMVQVAAGFGAMVNGGTYYSPTVIEGAVDKDGQLVKAAPKPAQPNVISPSTSSQMRDMVIKARRAFYASSDLPGYRVGGKTGTSQTIVNGSYENGQTIATYLGFGGDTKPRYVIMVEVSGKGKNLAGNIDAMPIFTDISNWTIDYLKLQPQR